MHTITFHEYVYIPYEKKPTAVKKVFVLRDTFLYYFLILLF